MFDPIEDHPYLLIVLTGISTIVIGSLYGHNIFTISISGLLSLWFAYWITVMLKLIFKISRPQQYQHQKNWYHYRFPSLHSSGAWAGTISMIMIMGINPWTTLLLGVAMMTCITRLQYHKFHEILAGSLVGIIIGIILTAFVVSMEQGAF